MEEKEGLERGIRAGLKGLVEVVKDHKRKKLKNLALMMISVLVVLLVCELIMRIFYGIPSSEMNHFSLSKSKYYQRDDEIKFVPRKNIRGVHNKKGSFSSTFQTNSRGLRDKEYKLDKTEGIKRIVVLGDSFTWGYGVNNNEIYTERLESILPNTEVINLGVTAYQLRQEITYFKREGIKYHPDIVIVGFCLNDIWHPSIINKDIDSNANAGKEMISRQSNTKDSSFKLRKYLKEHIIQKSALCIFIIDRMNTNKSLIKILAYMGIKQPLIGFVKLDINLTPALREYPNSLVESWETTKSELRQLKRLTADLGIRLIIAVIPTVQSIQDQTFKHTIAFSIFDTMDFDLDKPYRLLKEFAADENIEIVIPVRVFQQMHKEGRKLYLKRDMHFNAAGHDLFASAIAEYLNKPLTR